MINLICLIVTPNLFHTLKGNFCLIMVRVILSLTGKGVFDLCSAKDCMKYPHLSVPAEMRGTLACYGYFLSSKQKSIPVLSWDEMKKTQQTHTSSSVSFISISDICSVPEEMQVVPDRQHWAISSAFSFQMYRIVKLQILKKLQSRRPWSHLHSSISFCFSENV